MTLNAIIANFQTFKIQFLLKFLVQLFSVELGICTLKIKVTFKLDCVFLDVSWTALPFLFICSLSASSEVFCSLSFTCH